MVGTAHAPKHRQVYEALLQQIVSGRVKAGGRLPSEADLVHRFGASRITVARALRDLQVAGFVERRAGSGTFVRQARRVDQALSLGMVVPDFGDVEVFTPIYRGMLPVEQSSTAPRVGALRKSQIFCVRRDLPQITSMPGYSQRRRRACSSASSGANCG